MEVFVIDKWDENDLSDACIDKVFLKEENAKKYIERELKLLESARKDCIENVGFDDVPQYRYRITRKPIMELI